VVILVLILIQTERKFIMQNFDLEQNISGAFAPGREHSFAPQKISCNPFLTAKKVLIAKNEQSERSLLPECGADVLQSGRSMIESHRTNNAYRRKCAYLLWTAKGLYRGEL